MRLASFLGRGCCLLWLAASGCKSTPDGSLANSAEQELVGSGANACGPDSAAVLTNGMFDAKNPTGLRNAVIAVALAHQAYPYAWRGITMEETLNGLTPEKTDLFHRSFTHHWKGLGATTVEFVEAIDLRELREANAIVLGTERDVYVVFRGVSHFGQFIQSFRHNDMVAPVDGQKVNVWDSQHLAYLKIRDRLLKTVLAARERTQNPQAAKLWLFGHSTGAAYANFTAMEFGTRQPDFKVGGVYTFGSNMVGFDCAPGDICWTSLYNRRFGSVTYRWVNDADIASFMPVRIKPHQRWGHVPSVEQGLFRIRGERCARVFGDDATNCPRSMARKDGPPESGGCEAILGDHMSGIYVKKILACYLASTGQEASSASSGAEACARRVVEDRLLGGQFAAVSPKS